MGLRKEEQPINGAITPQDGSKEGNSGKRQANDHGPEMAK
jgi:hypothetical protein